MHDSPDPLTIAEMDRSIERLLPLERYVLLAHRVDGLPYSAIAEQSGLTTEAVIAVMADALYKLARITKRQRRPWWRRWF